MRLIVCDADQSDVQSALGNVDAPGATVLVNPQWLTPDPSEQLWIACGAPALKMIQAAGWIPKKGGVVSNRGKLFTDIKPDGWAKPICVGVTYAPQIMHIDYADFVKFQTDIAIYRRYEATGSMSAKLGKYTYAEDLSGVISYLKAEHARTGQPVDLALDTETEGLDPFNPEKRIVCLQASAMEGISDVIYVKDDHVGYDAVGKEWTATKRLETIIGQLQWIASQPWVKIIGANFKYDMLWLRVKWGIVFKNFTFDTCNGGSLCEENRPNTLNLHTKVYSPELGGYDDPFNATHDKSKMGEVPKPDLLPYAGGDTDACLRNYRKIRKELLADNLTPSGKPAKNSLTSVYLNIVHPTLTALHKMEYTGVCVDEPKFHEFGADLEGKMHEAMNEAAKVIPKSLIDKYGGLVDGKGAPLSKPAMIAEFLFTPAGLNLEPKQVTEKTQKPSTSEYHLSQFADHPEAEPVISRYLAYKSVSKMHGTYYVGFLNHLRSDGRWHPSYIIHKQGDDKNNEQAAAGTVTGRGSATAPAFQCVTGDAEIQTDGGIRTAASLIDPVLPHPEINPFQKHEVRLTGSTGMQTATQVFKSWRADLIRVVTQNGNELTCTPEHPFMTSTGEWVKAKDLDPGHFLRVPTKQDRAEAPQWYSPHLAIALGLIGAVANVQVTVPTIYLEVPEEFGEPLRDRLERMGAKVSVDYTEDHAVIAFNLGGSSSMDIKALVLNLPDPDNAGPPPEFRGTQAMYAYLRGYFWGRSHFKQRGKVISCRTYTTRLDVARAIQREFALEGVNPPLIIERKDGYMLDFKGRAAAIAAKIAGRSDLLWDFEVKRERADQQLKGLRIADVRPAGAGWVYDFTVPDIHDFYANGMLVHNTVPKHSYWGKRLRECIVAPPGYKIVARDYSQGELKVAACWAQEQKMIQAYLNGIDLHTLTAATVNGMSYEEAMFLKKNDLDAYKMLRQNGKAGNFGLLYGMSAYGFMMYADAAYGVKLSLEEAEHMRDVFFDLYPGLPMWHDRQILEASMNGTVRSPLGRIRHLPTIHSPIKSIQKTTQNQAINSPIQGTLVDMMWWSMGIIERERPELLVPFAQVHDQGLWYVPEDKEAEALAYSGEVMEALPFEEKFGWKPELVFNTDAEVGYDLANLTEVKA